MNEGENSVNFIVIMAGIDVNPDGIQFIVQPYQFEPHRGPEQPLSSSESSSESDSERDSDIDAVATDEWYVLFLIYLFGNETLE